METVPSLLHSVWNELRKASLADDREIIEYIAAVLTEGMESFPAQLRPQRPRNRYSVNDELISNLLAEASAIAGSKARLFDRYVLFYSTKVKDMYPIPRHITNFMLALAQLQPQQRFADLCCGTGGFLVNGSEYERRQRYTVGVELSPGWARIAAANAALHGMSSENTTIYVGDAFRLCTSDKTLVEDTFDRIVMAPPLTTPRNLAQARHALADFKGLERFLHEDGRFDEALFLLLALAKLASGGRAVLMVPSLLLDETSTHYELLRQFISEQYELKARIELVSGLLYPFTAQDATILVIDKRTPDTSYRGWRCTIRHDGYDAVRTRNLMEEPKETSNELPLVQTAILCQDKDMRPIVVSSSGKKKRSRVATKEVISSDGHLQGIVLKTLANTTLREIKKLLVTKQGQETKEVVLLATYHYKANSRQQEVSKQTLIIPLPPDSTLPIRYALAASRDKGKQDVRKQPGVVHVREDLSSPSFYYDYDPVWPVVVAITATGTICGSTLPDFVRKEEEGVLSNGEREAARVVAKGGRLQDKTKALLEPTEQTGLKEQAVVSQETPTSGLAPLYEMENFVVEQFLGTAQRELWQQICQQTGVEGRYALPFLPQQIETAAQIDIVQALELFERMGLIVQASLLNTESQGGTSVHYYRRITTNDVLPKPSNKESEQA
jgi:ubiquinone/menaquinone biosynthesis C-methylase UbiE